jgi:hypothetical protein
LKPPSFSPWTEILTSEEIQEYQRGNYRKFPLLHLIPKGVSLSELKLNKTKREVLPGFANDCWRFLVDVIILTAGSPYGKYMTVDIFRLYTRAVTLIFIRKDQTAIVDEVLSITGGASLGLVVTFLVCLVLLYKCRRIFKRDLSNHHLDEVLDYSFV